MNTDPVYREVQQFRQRWLWALLSGTALLMLVFGPVSWPGLVIVGVVAAFVYSLRLETEVRADGIYLKMWPLHRSFRRIAWSEIDQYEARTYRPLREFGGWGIRWASGKRAYNVSGTRGVWIQRTNASDVLVGSQHADDFVTAINEVSTN
ncbi:hypothetical protein [Saliphagus infecundisoli]|uniref:PH domain-containing protein n=1 Tax=Saliphagus infecundisoli TaxID=1849069 RepID=A0ABD5QCB8_9EURY|nr:hypothetical protein [Saliphagus infecundisoli]